MLDRCHFPSLIGLLALGLCCSVDATQVFAEDSNAAQIEFFESKVRPLLVDKCWKCHSSEKQSGNLRLDSLQHLVDGGDSGPAIDPVDVEGSLLLQAVRYESLEMPPDQKLSTREIEVLQRWIQAGAKWPNQVAMAAKKRDSEDVTDLDRLWWAFQPIVRPEIPESYVDHPIDYFIEKKLSLKGLKRSPRAEPQKLVRRTYFDLIGLPPSIDAVNAISHSDDPAALDRLVDDLLNRFEYGERWGRHWLDVVRFAQTNGYERDDEKPLAWRYRDYVIRSFNDDKPYDQFVREQLAGDEMHPLTDDGLDATGFYRLGVWDDEPDDERQAEFDGLDDMLSTTGTAFLGLSIGCARCHSHKFDPIPHEDYYRMLAFIRNVKPYEKAENENSSVFQDLPSGNGRTLAVSERGIESPVTNVLFRGDSGSPGPEVSPGFPRVLFPSLDQSVASVRQPEETARSTGRRTEFANWIASEQNPLTARVIVNRLWHYHFGVGLVDTPSDFGKTGSLPSHPELLDYLASELIAGGWRLKPIHRLILSSKTWQQSSGSRDALAEQIDPGNRLLWRQNVRRLEAEAIRDSVLSLAGTLNMERGGRGFFPQMPPEVLAGQSRPGHGWDDSETAQRNRRSVYVFAKRGITDPLLEIFDVATTDQPVPDRTSTTVAPQALTLLNSGFIADQSNAAADRLIKEGTPNLATDIARDLWQLAFSRVPGDGELELLVSYYRQQLESFQRQPPTIRFRQAVPTALNTPVLERRKPHELLDGPSAGWKYSKGMWNDIGDLIFMVQMHQTPAALYQGVTFREGTVRGRIRVDGQPDTLSIAVGASIEGDLLQATEFVFSGVTNDVTLRKSGRDPSDIQSAPFVITPHVWTDFVITVDDANLSLRLNDQLMLDSALPELRREGCFAVRAWGAGIEVANLQIEISGITHYPVFEAPAGTFRTAEQKALAALCNLVINLNEFVYVD